MKNSENEIHVGAWIKSKSKDLRVGPTELGARIQTSKQNVYGIFKRQSIDTELLARISIALDYDFFHDLSQAHIASKKLPRLARKLDKIDQIAKIDSPPLERENAYLRRINMLLEEKVFILEAQLGAKSES